MASTPDAVTTGSAVVILGNRIAGRRTLEA